MERFVCNLPTRNYSGCDLDHIYFKNMNMVAHISSLAVALAAVLFGSHSYRVPIHFRHSAWRMHLYVLPLTFSDVWLFFATLPFRFFILPLFCSSLVSILSIKFFYSVFQYIFFTFGGKNLFRRSVDLTIFVWLSISITHTNYFFSLFLSAFRIQSPIARTGNSTLKHKNPKGSPKSIFASNTNPINHATKVEIIAVV